MRGVFIPPMLCHCGQYWDLKPKVLPLCHNVGNIYSSGSATHCGLMWGVITPPPPPFYTTVAYLTSPDDGGIDRKSSIALQISCPA